MSSTSRVRPASPSAASLSAGSLPAASPPAPTSAPFALDDLFAALRTAPDKPAVITCRRGQVDQLSYGALLDRARRLVGGLRRQGLEPRDRVLVLTRPGETLFVTILGLLLGGMVPVLADPGLGLDRMLSCIQDAQVDGVIGLRRARLLRWLRPQAFQRVKAWVTTDGRFPGTVPLARLLKASPQGSPAVDPESTALIVFTSGSTGPAKGVEMTYRNLEGSFASFRALMGEQRPGELDLMALPAVSLISLGLGRSCLIPDINFSRLAQVDGEHLLGHFQRFPVSVAFVSPILCYKLAERAVADPTPLPRVRVLMTGGAPIPARVAVALRKLLPHGEFYPSLGATEVLPATLMRAQEIEEETGALTEQGKGVCVGLPLPQTEIRIIQPVEGPIPVWQAELQLPPGQIGEIVVRGPQVSPRYYRREAETRLAKIPDPAGGFWHRMGDMGYLDEKGRLWFCGRKKHRVITPEGVFYPVCAEGIFNTLAFVYRSALVGAGGGLALVVEPRRKPSRKETQAWRQRILELAAAHDLPLKHVLFYPKAFPTDRRHNSKIERLELAAWAERRVG